MPVTGSGRAFSWSQPTLPQVPPQAAYSVTATLAGGHAGAADAADDEEIEVVGHLAGSLRKNGALPWTRWGRRPQTPLPKIAYDLWDSMWLSTTIRWLHARPTS